MQDAANKTSIYHQVFWCVYPISGTYTRFQRILFYATIVVAFMFRYHEWVSSVAMGSVFLYSIVAVVHSIPMSLQPSLGADADFIALYSIVYASVLCAVMARMYSPRFFGRNFNTLYVCWIIGLSIQLCSLVFAMVRFGNSIPDHLVQLGCPNISICLDPCVSQQPRVLFRGGQFDATTGVLIYTWRETVLNSSGNQTPTLRTPEIDSHESLSHLSADRLGQVAILYLLFILGERNQNRPPRLARNHAFRRLYPKRVISTLGSASVPSFTFHIVYYAYLFWIVFLYFLLWRPLTELFLQKSWLQNLRLNWSIEAWVNDRSRLEEVSSKSRERYARNIALAWYLLCMLGYVGVPIMALLVTFSLEHILIQVPESEGPQTIGQWGPVVGLVTTLFVIFLIRRRVPTPNPHNSQYMRPRQGEDDLFSYRPSQLSQHGQPDQSWYWKNRIIAASIKEWRDLKDWWRDPIVVSREHHHEEFTPDNHPPAAVSREPSDDTV